MAETLKITDGTTEIDFHGGTYHVLWEGWTPRVANRLPDGSGGHPYEDVEEEISFTISGATATAIRTSLSALMDLLYQSQRWWNGENVDAVTVQYEPKSSTQGTVATAIAGRFELEVNAEYHTLDDGLQLGNADSPLILRFWRRGAWLAGEETANFASASAGAAVRVASFGAVDEYDRPSPFLMRITGLDNNGSWEEPSGAIIFGAGTLLLNAVEAEDADFDFQFSTISGTAVLASGGSVARCTSDTGYLSFLANTFSGTLKDEMGQAHKVAGFIVARSSASDTTWQVKLESSAVGPGTGTGAETRPVEFNNTTPAVISLGTIVNSVYETIWYDIYFERLSGSGNVEVDYAVFADASRPEFAAIALNSVRNWLNTGTDGNIEINHLLLERPRPQVFSRSVTAGVKAPIPFRGEPIPGMMGTAIYFVPMLTGGDSASNWRYGSSGAADTFGGSFLRRVPYLVPE